MPNHPLFYPAPLPQQSASLRDQVQIGLAIADTAILESLLVDGIPPVTQRHLLGSVTAQIGIPTPHNDAVDGILNFEAVKCVLTNEPAEPERKPGESRRQQGSPRWESDTLSLEPRLTLAQAIAVLEEAGFSHRQIEEILYLPSQAGHKSWWATLDAEHQFTAPFLRLIRTLRFTDGTFTIQYKDFFDQEKPCCFKSQPQQALVEIRPDGESFAETVKRINLHRADLGITHVVLICNILSELEAQALISQGISLYPAVDLMLPTQANCALCGTRQCAMNGQTDSPILLCRNFSLDGVYA